MPRMNCDGTDFGEVGAVEVKRAASDDFAIVFQDNEIANVFANFGKAAGKECPITGVGGD